MITCAIYLKVLVWKMWSISSVDCSERNKEINNLTQNKALIGGNSLVILKLNIHCFMKTIK